MNEPTLRYKKMLQTIEAKHGNVSQFYADKAKRAAGIPKASGFGSDKIGKDGKTGRERAVEAGRKGGSSRKGMFYVK